MIRYFDREGIFALDNANISYVFKVERGHLAHVYFGKKIHYQSVGDFSPYFSLSFTCPLTDEKDKFDNLETMLREYPTFGSGDFKHPAADISVESGNRCVNLLYDSHEIVKDKPMPEGLPAVRGGETLIVTLKDKSYGVRVKLFYTVYEDADTIVRRAEITNLSGGEMTVDRAMSFCLDSEMENATVVTLRGCHSSEAHVEKTPLSYGTFEVSSAAGITSHTANPFMALTASRDEDKGDAVGVNLIYGGSFAVFAEKRLSGRVRLSGGINPFGFSWKLKKGETFVTPEAVIAFSPCGLDGLSREFHKLYRAHLINPAFMNKPCPIVANSWEAYYFDFDEAKLLRFIDKLEGTDVDVFVLDDGWFGSRDSADSSLGDWVVNRKKLPNGLKPLIERCKSVGVKFGIWIEPEMISENSDLYRAHPDWAIAAPHGEKSYARNQLVLDITRREVLDYVKNAVYKLLSENEIAYVKWDMNRYVTQNYSSGLSADRQKEFSHRYALAFYELCSFLTKSFPNVFFEGCSGGGGRMDPGMFAYFPQVWASDATDANERTKIMYGWSLCYPLCALSSHITHSPNVQNERAMPMKTRFAVSALGSFGYEYDVANGDGCDFIKEQIGKYREIERVSRYGDLYRLSSPYENEIFSVMTVSSDAREAYLWYYRRLVSYDFVPPRIRLKGLLPNKRYTVDGLGLTAYGDTLMNFGITLPVRFSDFNCELYKITCID